MSSDDARSTRRTVLKTVGGTAVGLTATAGAASAKHLDPAEPVVKTEEETNVTDTGATLNGFLEDFGGAHDAEVFFEWGEADEGLPNTTEKQFVENDDKGVSFCEDVSLLCERAYEFRAVVEAGDGQSDTGQILEFVTDLCSTF